MAVNNSLLDQAISLIESSDSTSKTPLTRPMRSIIKQNPHLAYSAYLNDLIRVSQLPDFTKECESLLPRLKRIRELEDVLQLYIRGIPFNSLYRPARILDKLNHVPTSMLKRLYYDTHSTKVFKRLIIKECVDDLMEIAYNLKNSSSRLDRNSYQNLFLSEDYAELVTSNDMLSDLFLPNHPVLIIRCCIIHNYSYPLRYLTDELPDGIMSELFREGDRINCHSDNLRQLIQRLKVTSINPLLVSEVLNRFGWRHAVRIVQAMEDEIGMLNQCLQILDLSKIPRLSCAMLAGLTVTYDQVLDRILCPGWDGVIEQVISTMPTASLIQVFIYLIITLDETPYFNYQLLNWLSTLFRVKQVRDYLNHTIYITDSDPDVALNRLGINLNNNLQVKVASRYLDAICGETPPATGLRQLVRMEDNEIEIVKEVHQEIMSYYRVIESILSTYR